MKIKFLFLAIILISACSPASPVQPSVVTPISSATPEPSLTPSPTPDLAYRKILSVNPSETANGAEYFFDDGMTTEEQTIVKKSVDLAYSYVSEFVNGETIPAEIYVMKDCVKLNEAFAAYLAKTGEVSGVGSGACAKYFAQIKGVFISYDPTVFENKADNLSAFVIHEYFHVIQNYIAKNNQIAEGRIAPPWMLEGSADYFKLLLLGDLESKTASESWLWREDYLRTNTKTVAELGNEYEGVQVYSLGSLAVRYLVDTYGYDSLINLFQVIGSDKTWEDSFGEVFGMSPDTFSANFESYRAVNFAYITPVPTIAVGMGTVTGKILSEKGDPVPKVLVLLCKGNPPCPSVETDENGAFSISLPADHYEIWFKVDGINWSGYYYDKNPSNFTPDRSISSVFNVHEGKTTDEIVIRVPADVLIDSLSQPCGYPLPVDDGKKYVVEGIVTNLSGEILAGYSIGACPKFGGCYGHDSTNGKFKIQLPNGIYFLGVNDPNAGPNTPPVGWYGGAGVITKTQTCEGAIYVNGANVTDIIITYP